jgi:phosphoglucomutase
VIYRELTHHLSTPGYDHIEAPATSDQQELLKRLSAVQIRARAWRATATAAA